MGQVLAVMDGGKGWANSIASVFKVSSVEEVQSGRQELQGQMVARKMTSGALWVGEELSGMKES